MKGCARVRDRCESSMRKPNDGGEVGRGEDEQKKGRGRRGLVVGDGGLQKEFETARGTPVL